MPLERMLGLRSLVADLQMVNISMRVLSKPAVDKLPEIFKVSSSDNSFTKLTHCRTCNTCLAYGKIVHEARHAAAEPGN